eukprot:10065745-Alexandrium_andersonii.AAC.1
MEALGQSTSTTWEQPNGPAAAGLQRRSPRSGMTRRTTNPTTTATTTASATMVAPPGARATGASSKRSRRGAEA